MAAAEIQIGSEVPILLRIPVAPFHRAEKARPIEIGRLLRHSGRRLLQVSSVAMPPSPCHCDFTEESGLDHLFFGTEIDDAGALLHADLADPVVDTVVLDYFRP